MYGGGLNKCVQLPQILSQTSTSAQIYITWATDSAGYYGSVTWLAIGKQQWGYGTWENTQRIITVTLPIPFTNTKYFSTKNVPTLAAGHYTEDNEICTFNQTTTTFQFYHQHNAKIGDIYQWFAIGL